MACLSSSASLIPLFLRHYIRNQETVFCTVGQSATRTSKGKFAIAQILIVSHVLPQTAQFSHVLLQAVLQYTLQELQEKCNHDHSK